MFIIIDTEEIRILNILRFPRASVEPLQATPYASHRSLFSRDVQDVLVSALPHDVAVLADQESSYIQDAQFLLVESNFVMNNTHQILLPLTCDSATVNISPQIL